jgi:hypothetical protein
VKEAAVHEIVVTSSELRAEEVFIPKEHPVNVAFYCNGFGRGNISEVSHRRKEAEQIIKLGRHLLMQFDPAFNKLLARPLCTLYSACGPRYYNAKKEEYEGCEESDGQFGDF